MPAESGWEDAVRGGPIHDALAEPVVADIELQVDISVGISFAPERDDGLPGCSAQPTGDAACLAWPGRQYGLRPELGQRDWRPAADHGTFDAGLEQDSSSATSSRKLDVLTDEGGSKVDRCCGGSTSNAGLIPAEQFLPMLEQTAIIRPLTDFVRCQPRAVAPLGRQGCICDCP